jgi:hypothetical protein
VFAYGLMAAAVVLVINADSALPRVDVSNEAAWLVALAALVAVEHFVDMPGGLSIAIKVAVLMVVSAFVWRNARRFIQPAPNGAFAQ